ncbi:MAG: 5-oxoprolinase subunit PxpB [Pyrinomonadaceae bacterium]
MAAKSPRIFPLGDSALTVEFGNVISEELNKNAIALAAHFDKNNFPGFIESVPSYASTTLFYDPFVVRKSFPKFFTAFDAVKHLAEAALENITADDTGTMRLVEIPVYFDSESSLDLEFVAATNNISPDEVIEIFLAKTYRVYMLGFLPGFSYMGEVDGRIATPRRDTPRTVVPKGSVGIAGSQTGIYSLESPGGWQIIGRTDVEMFSPNAPEPCYLRPGDEVRFVAAK